MSAKRNLVFNNLHSHSHYSIGDATAHVDKFVKKCKMIGSKAVSLTEHGTLASTYELYTECKKNDIKPILGIEAYLVDDYDSEAAQIPYNYFHTVILCKDEKGWNNLKQLQSHAWSDGYLRKPRISLDALQGRSEGLIVLSACVGGLVGSLSLGLDKFYTEIADRNKILKKRLAFFNDVFGKDFYFEIQTNDIDIQAPLNQKIMKLSKKYGREVVLTNDTHYLSRKDWQIHDVMLCKHWRKTLADDDNGCYSTHQLFVKGPNALEYAREQFHDYIDPKFLRRAINVTQKIEEKIKVYPLVPQKSTLPKFGDGDSMETLVKLCKKGYKKLLTTKQQKSKTYRRRLERELKVIKKIGYPDYFLLVWDIVRKCKKKNITVGPGRGSVCGSLVAYLLEITQIDPIRFNLLFERFLNEDRVSMPDIDMDFSRDRRNDVMKIMKKMYGDEKLAQIANYGKWKPRGVITDVGRVLGHEFTEIKKHTKLIDNTVEKWKEIPKDMRKFLNKNKTLKNRARRLMSTVNYRGVHASGISITPTDITKWIPIAYTVDRSDEAKQLVKITEWDMYALEELDILKFDRLGLTTLDIISSTVDLVNKRYGKNTIKNLDLECLSDLGNLEVYKMMRKGELQGIFQLETSQSMGRLLRDMKPKCFNDIAVTISLHRTAVLKAGMHTEYVKRKNLADSGRADKIKMIHPMLKEILKETYGILIFQEQVMSIGHVMGNMTLREADNFRKAIKLKDSEKFKVWQKKFMKGAKENNIKKKIAKQVWDWMYKFSGYGFNLSHAVAYAFIAFQTAWLKSKYRQEFMASVMTYTQKGDRAKEKLPKCILECREYFKILPPLINHSSDRFEVFGKNLLFPFSAIKGVGENAVNAIKMVQEQGKIKSFIDFFNNVNKRVANVGVLVNLILSGAFRKFGDKEEIFDELMESRGKDSVRRQLFCYECRFRYPCAIKKDETPKCPVCGSASVTVDIEHCFGKKFDHSYCENNLVFGFNIIESPLKKYLPEMIKGKFLDFDEIFEKKPDTIIKTMATVTGIKKWIDKREQEMAFIRLRDLHGVEADLCIFAGDWRVLKKIMKEDGNYKMRLLKTESKYGAFEGNSFLFDNRNKSFIKQLK